MKNKLKLKRLKKIQLKNRSRKYKLDKYTKYIKRKEG